MKAKKLSLFLIPFLLILLLSNAAWADKAEVRIDGPNQASPGEEITVLLTIIHSADNFFHHVDWVEVWLNNQTAYRWEYSASQLPPAATFTKEIKVQIKEDTEIKAEADCNIHGSKGPAMKKISVAK
jgi:desulfoferrodoxin (superoxide reductase-like protein)